MKEIFQNLIAFMERVPVTGKEAVAWCQAYAFLQNQLTAPTEPVDESTKS